MKISIIIISYNQEKYIDQTLKSILNQTKQPFEVIIADDGSSDSTPNIISKFVKENECQNWKLLLNDHNRGITTNLKDAIEFAKGDILMLNAGDDISYPNRVILTEEAFKKYPETSIVTGNLDIIDSSGNVIGEIINSPVNCNDILKTINNGMPHVHPVGQSIKRNLFEKFGPLPTDVPNEDDQISFRGLIYGGIVCLPEKIMKYRIHNTSASAWIRNKQNVKWFYQRFLRDMPIRKKHMELWLEALHKTRHASNSIYLNSLQKRIQIYDYLSQLDTIAETRRVIFFLRNYKFLHLKEIVYILLGKYGVYFWQYVRNAIKNR